MIYAIIKRDGKAVGFSQTNEQMGGLEWFSRNVLAYSMDHAIKHEGYSIELVEDVDCHKVERLLTEIASAKGIGFSTSFLPFSQSHNAKTKWKSLNWKCILIKNGQEMHSFTYSQGVANCPAYKEPFKFESGKIDRWKTDNAIDNEIENGRTFNTFGKQHKFNPPSSGELLRCLLVDVSRVLYSDFESFCAELGYDSDSKKAENIFNECKKTMENLVKVFTYSEIEDLINLANQG